MANKIFHYEQRNRTLQEVAELMGVSFELKLLKNNLWHAKLEQLSLVSDNPSERKYIICRNENPNYAMSLLCEKISYKTVSAPQKNKENKIVTLGLVQKGPLYLRYYEGGL